MKRKPRKAKISGKPLFDKCQFCGLDPNLKENAGCQVYLCDGCEARVCSGCSENGGKDGNEVFCDPCVYDRKQLALEQSGKV